MADQVIIRFLSVNCLHSHYLVEFWGYGLGLGFRILGSALRLLAVSNVEMACVEWARFGRPPPPRPMVLPPPCGAWCGVVVGCFPPPCGVVWFGCGLWWFPPFPPCGVVWVGWFPPACLDLLGVFGKPMLMMILMMMMMMTIIMIIIITIILVFLWLVVGYLLPTCLLTIMALLTVGPRSL